MLDAGVPRSPELGEPVPVLPGDVVPADAADLELVCDIWSADAHIAREHARQAATIAALAARRAAEHGTGHDPARAAAAPAREVALTDVTQEFIAELALIRCCSEIEASRLAVEAVALTTVLAPTWSALFAGRLSVRQARVLLDLLADTDPEVAAGVQAKVLPGAEGCPPARLADRARYHLYRLDADARDRRRRAAEARADVTAHRTPEGTGRLVVDGPLPAVHAARDAIDTYARLLAADGDPRPLGQLRAAVALDLVLRPWDTTRPPVTAQLTLHAALPALHPDAPPGAPPAQLDGGWISAAHCRELLAALDVLGPRRPPGGSIHLAVDDPATGATLAVATRAELARAAGTPGRRRRRRRRRGRTGGSEGTGTGRRTVTAAACADPPADPPESPPAADGPGLAPPPATAGYRPTAAQRRLVTTRDRRCRMPGCGARPGRCDLDHGRAHARGGPTACWNLCCLCRRHHRIKTHARRWAFTLLPDGRLVVRTPAGITRTTTPPGWYHDPAPDPPELEETAPPDPQRG